MENLESFVAILSTILIILAYFVKLIETISKNKSLINKNITYEELMELIKLSEELFDHGEDKKRFVIENIKNFASNNKFKLDIDEIDRMIEKYVSLTNKVNIEKGKENE